MMRHRINRKKYKEKRQLGWTGRTGLILLALLILLQPMLSYSGFAADTAESAAESQLEPEGDPTAGDEIIPEEVENSTAEAEDAESSEYESVDPAQKPEQETGAAPEEAEPSPVAAAEPGAASTMAENSYVTVRIHDMASDGTEILNDDQSCFSMELAAGTALQQGFEQQETVIGSGDTRTLAGKLVYYQQDEDGQKYRYSDLSQPVSEDLELYTYQYRLCIYTSDEPGTITPEDDAGDSAQENEAELTPLLELTAREGQLISAERLNIDGTDLTALTWQDESNGEAVDIASLISGGLSANLNVWIADTATEENLERAATDTATVTFFVAVDGEWKQLQQITTSNRPNLWKTSNGYRYAVAAEDLYEIYKDYGLTQETLQDMNGKLIFPHTDSYDTGHIWADTAPKQADGKWWIPVSARATSYVYYMPQNVPGNESYFATSCVTLDSSKITANSFFHLDVLDPQGLLGSGETLPEEQLIPPGGSAEVTLPVKDNVEWRVRNKSTSATLNENEDYTVTEENGKITFRFTSLSCPARIIAVVKGGSSLAVEYRADVTPSKVQLGQFADSQQSIIQNGMVYGQVTYLEENLDLSGNYRVLSPDYDYAELYYSSGDAKKRRVFYTFKGWKVGDSDTILQPGVYSGAEIKQYMDGSDVLELNAVWQGTDGGAVDRVATVNFFVNLACEIMDNTGNGYNPAPESAFTGSVYATRVYGGENVPFGNASDRRDIQIIAPPENADSAYEVDARLRETVNTPISDADKTYALQLESFPSDEYVFNELRQAGAEISLDGEIIPTEQLNSDNFQIRWYVLKYDHSDGWHVDGILVAKEAQLVIKKTFAGDDSAFAEIKNQENPFYLEVTHLDENSQPVEDYHLTLDQLDAESNATEVGYTEYDDATHTYTWVLGARQGRTYTVKECNYLLDTKKWNHTNRYRIRNSASVTEQWKNYDTSSTISVVAEAYASDLPKASYQTVEFENLYVKAGLLTVHKVDSATNNGLKNVSFRLSLENGNPLKLYHMPNTSYYSTDNNAVKDGYTELAEDNTLVTDSNGYFYVKLGIFEAAATKESYILEEDIPTGYEGAKKTRVVVSDDGTVQMAQEVLESTLNDNSEWIQGQGTATLTLLNRSKLLTEVKAQKIWENTSKDEQLPVKVELRCNGIRLRGSYVQVLNDENHWTYVWENLPLFVDGEMAQYTIHETVIGDEDYDPDVSPDGYEDYLVEYDDAKYKEGAEGEYTSTKGYWEEEGQIHYADHALLVVHNSYTKGKIAFEKVGDRGSGIAGALFALYRDHACTEEVTTAESGDAGFVEFPAQARGTYYMKEITAPVGYGLNDMVYTIVIKSGAVTITDSDGKPVTKIVNHSAVPMTIQKTDTGGNLLSGAVFTVYRTMDDGSETVYGTYTTGQNGTVTTKKLEQGVYRIEETQAPTGYRLRTDSFTIQVEDGVISPASTPELEDWTEWKFEGEPEDGYILTVTDHALYQLPSAGGSGIGWPMAIGCMFMCAAAAGYLLWLRRQRCGQGM